MKTVPIGRLYELLICDADTGVLRWKSRVSRNNAWNARYAGARAGNEDCGYWAVKIDGDKYKAHRVVWAMVTGEWPSQEIDHENGDGSDNRWVNLRHVSGPENKKNKPLYRNNTSGVIGISWRPDKQFWAASIGVDGKSKHIGNFIDKEQAILARRAAEFRYGFHENHGRSA